MSASDEIKQRIDIVDLVSRYTQLKKSGSSYSGLCPFHSERTPSFVVFPHTGSWHCFGACGTGGDIFSFIMKKENLDFREALQMLAQEAGVQLEDAPRDQKLRATIYELNELAAAYFEEMLHAHPDARSARDYLRQRGIHSDTARQFRIGYALDSWDGLRNYLMHKGATVEQLLEAGLIKRNEAKDSSYDAFRGRVIMPIFDRRNRVIGFGGRVLDDSQPKYLNTAETPVFHKSHVVYGIERAQDAIRAADKVVIVEGYMDVIAAHQHGFANVVACMGTALTPEQLRQLQRFTSTYVLALDADSAGQQATIRGLNQARQSLTRITKPVPSPTGLRLEERLGANLYIAAMPEGRDPDDVIRGDSGAWEKLIDGAKPLVDFYFDVVARHADLTAAQGKGAAVAELSPLIAELEDNIEREHYIQRLSRLVQLDEQTIVGRVQAVAKTRHLASQLRKEQAQDNRTDVSSSIQGGRPGARTPGNKPEGTGRRRTGAEGTAAGTAQTGRAPAPGLSDEERRRRAGLGTEEYLLAILLQAPDLLMWLDEAATERSLPPLRDGDWQHVEHQEIFRALKHYLSGAEPWDVEIFQENLASQLHGRLAHLTAAATRLPTANPEELQTDLLKTLVRIRLDRLQTDTTQLRFLIDTAHRSGDRESLSYYYSIQDRHIRDKRYLELAQTRLGYMFAAQGRAGHGAKIR
ncbi:MAG: DNA primase [Litorilinea sp.]